MTPPHDTHPVSDTAALVMLWASEYYRKNPLIDSYLKRLDLSAGSEMFDRYNRICPWYSEAIVNRKHFLSSTVRALIGRIPGDVTIVNLGAGFSPMTLEFAPLLSPRCRFVEIDESGMDLKQSLYSALVPDRFRFISCLEADVADSSSLETTLSRAAGSLVVVMEGLSYYIPRLAMERILFTLSGIPAVKAVLFEHLKPCRLVREKHRFIPHRIFSDVRDYTGLSRLTTYTEAEIREMLTPGFACSYYDMDEMEKRRTGQHRYFPAPDCGWLSCAVATRAL